ncbi:hypothetical protein D0463_11670 [Bacillus sp. V59.32b]|nr:hypothetical protein D0463_11670 [Bacillus sp. V59.32b]
MGSISVNFATKLIGEDMRDSSKMHTHFPVRFLFMDDDSTSCGKSRPVNGTSTKICHVLMSYVDANTSCVSPGGMPFAEKAAGLPAESERLERKSTDNQSLNQFFW